MSRAEAFVAEFARVWDDASVEGHAQLWSEDIVLVQPLMGTLRGKAACRKGFGRLFALVPDLRADVHRWAAAGDGAIFIEFTLSGRFAGRRIAWDAVDRFVLDDDGLIASRISYFDGVPVGLAMALRPRGWWRLVSSRALGNPFATQTSATSLPA